MTWALIGNIKGATGADGTDGVSGVPVQTAQTGTYTFVLGDAYACTPFDSAYLSIAYIPANASVAFALGTTLYTKQVGTGAVAFSGLSGVTVNQIAGNASFAPGMWLKAVKSGTDTWDVSPYVQPKYGAPPNVASDFGVVTLNAQQQDTFYMQLTEDVTTFSVAFVQAPPTGYSRVLAVRFQQAASGGPYSVTFPSNLHFMAGSDTEVQSGAGVYTLLIMVTFDGGTRWEGMMRACGT